VRDRYNGRVFDTVIPTNISLAEAPAAGKPIMSYAPTSLGATAYRALSREVWARYAC
jgi:chromosome partitioning protein